MFGTGRFPVCVEASSVCSVPLLPGVFPCCAWQVHSPFWSGTVLFVDSSVCSVPLLPGVFSCCAWQVLSPLWSGTVLFHELFFCMKQSQFLHSFSMFTWNSPEGIPSCLEQCPWCLCVFQDSLWPRYSLAVTQSTVATDILLTIPVWPQTSYQP